MKKIKKHLPLVKSQFMSITSCSIKFTNNDSSLSILQLKDTEMFVSAPDYRPSSINARPVLRRFFGPIKMKYRYIGKTYRVRTKQNVIFMRFNKSHKTYLMHNNKLIYFKNKGFWLTMWKTHKEVIGIRTTLNLLRPRNRFTSRGIWNRKSFFYKKKGKISGYR